MACLQVSSMLINCTMWSSYLFSASSCFPRFSWSRFFSVQVFQGPGFSGFRFFRVQGFLGPGFSGSRSRVRVQVLEVAIKKEALAQMFSCEFCEISKNNFFCRTPPDDCICPLLKKLLVLSFFFCYINTALWGTSSHNISNWKS